MLLENEDRSRLNVATGYCELGMWQDANAELGHLKPDLRHLPEVLEVRIQIYSGLGSWNLMQVAAGTLVGHDPANVQWTVWLAFATRRAESLEAAYSILLAAVERHPEAAILHYNLACYECQLGKLAVAAACLRQAITLEASFEALALADEDLEPLRDSLRE